MFLVYGHRKFFNHIFEPLFYKCPYCESENSTEVFIYSRYFHIFWIPAFPVRKIAVAKCTKCDSFRPEEKFGPKLTDHVNEEFKKTKHPFYAWSLLIFLGLLILLIIIVSPKE